MNLFTKIFILIVLVFSIIYLNMFGFTLDGFEKFKIPIKKTDKNQNITEEIQTTKDKELKMQTITLYYLAVSKSGENFFRTITKEIPQDNLKLKTAILQLLQNNTENCKGCYSEIPNGVKLLSYQENEQSIIINLSSNFQYGGGTDSLYSRIKQLIKTILANNTSNKPVYLYLDGQQADVVGGEGIMIKQPLMENSLDD